jgi:peptidoglycan hydrolase-like protein with peptidoglycan-binding domain
LFGRGKRTSTLKQRPTHHARSPDQSLSSVQKGEDMPRQSYIDSEQDLQKGSVDDRGDAKYVRLEQNVPDGFVYDLQTDLYGMGFTILEEADGAFGQQTEKAVKQFQERAKIPQNGIVDHVTKNEIMTWLNHGYTKKTRPQKKHPPNQPTRTASRSSPPEYSTTAKATPDGREGSSAAAQPSKEKGAR